jgi:uracil phosphoribosyltransferase
MSMRDSAYQELPRALPQLRHRYGPNVRILADVSALTMLSRLGHPATRQPDFNRILLRCYDRLFDAVVETLFPRVDGTVPTRMAATVPGAAYRGPVVDPDTRVVLVGLARAGTLPAYRGYEVLHDVLHPDRLRVDHVAMQRKTDGDGRVVGVESTGSKFGGDVDRAIVLLPDPMGATGGSMSDAVSLVKAQGGTPQAIVAVNLIVTPEYLRRLGKDHPDAHVFALRLDRGMSTAQALSMLPGESTDERGCNEIQYIVPGAGGVGELINNSFA